jgi:serine protease AprX
LKPVKSFALVAAVLLLGSTAFAAPAKQQVRSRGTQSVSPAKTTSRSGSASKARQASVARREAVARAARTAELRGVPDDGSRELDRELRRRSTRELGGYSAVIVELKPGYEGLGNLGFGGGKLGRRLRSFNGQVVTLPNAQLKRLAKHPAVQAIHYDRPIADSLTRATWTVGARAVQQRYGFTGKGVGVAIIDSGVSAWHDDLTGVGNYPYGNQRVLNFMDFVGGQTTPYDDNGHGTHVAGIVAGNGYDSAGGKLGIAPDSNLVVLKVLDEMGNGTISGIIAALDYAIANKDTYNIRVINMSVGAGVFESYETDPLTLAAKRAVDAGIVVVAAAGNMGRNAAGALQYGAITAPGNAPWVLTVGASSTSGTIRRSDDTMAAYSSRGPTAVDFLAKPDLVAPGTGIVSLASPNSLMYQTKASALLPGSTSTAYMPYLSLSGTSMASPVVAGSVALMLEANPALTPNLVKAILQYTAQVYPGYDYLTEGAGFLNTSGAVRLARFFAHPTPGQRYPRSAVWSRHILWGNQVLSGGAIIPSANAWDDNVVWGSSFSPDGDNIVWGSDCVGSSCNNVVWGTQFGDDNIVWGSDCPEFFCDNIVWGSTYGGFGDNIVWGSSFGQFDDNIVWGSSFADFDNIVWGSSLDALDNVVWGSSAFEFDNIVWGSNCGGWDCDNIVWGSSFLDMDNIVWGSDCNEYFCDNIVWGSNFGVDNIVWGSSIGDPFGVDNIVWGSSFDQLDNIVWGSSTGDANVVPVDGPTEQETLDALDFDADPDELTVEPTPDPTPDPDPAPEVEPTSDPTPDPEPGS